MKNYRMMFFDFDGTIIDSLWAKGQAFVELSIFDDDRDSDDYIIDYHLENPSMSRRQKIMHYIYSIFDRTPSTNELDELCQEFSRIVVDKILGCLLIKDALKFLANNRSYRVLLSSTPHPELFEILDDKALMNYFSVYQGSIQNKAKSINEYLTFWGIDKKDCCLFGDSREDQKAAERVGIDFYKIDNQTGFTRFLED